MNLLKIGGKDLSSEKNGNIKDDITKEEEDADASVNTTPALELSDDGSHSDTNNEEHEDDAQSNEGNGKKNYQSPSDTAEEEQQQEKETLIASCSKEQEPEDEALRLLKTELASNQKWILKSHPPTHGTFIAERDAELINDPLDEHLNKLKRDEVIVRVDILGIDPFLRTMMDAGEEIGTLKPNDPIRAIGVGTVLRCHQDANGSNDVDHEFSVGSVVVGLMGVAKYAIVSANLLQVKMAFAKPSSALGVLGTVGETAYIGTFVAPSNQPPQKDEMVVVSNAAGPIGCLVCQMAKFKGAKVVGIIGGYGCGGGEEKKQFLLDQLKLDGVVDVESNASTLNDHTEEEKDSTTTSTEAKSIYQQLKDVCPNGIDFVFDSVGGDILDQVLNHINTKARVVICDATSQYQCLSNIHGPSSYLKLVEKSASLHGFNLMDYPEHSFATTTYLGWNYIRGNFIFPQRIETGLDIFASSMEDYFTNQHALGRLMVQISDQFEIKTEFPILENNEQEANDDGEMHGNNSNNIPAAQGLGIGLGLANLSLIEEEIQARTSP